MEFALIPIGALFALMALCTILGEILPETVITIIDAILMTIAHLVLIIGFLAFGVVCFFSTSLSMLYFF
ncbi:MAG: hypothetical protein A3B74_04690 [Candidatus Kerfeldbacteria bacterium RIFCSPHIGHO2_02_FULL_42_14]|uniref:Uncharacterized protein n=1 Tax=Candidatus Kerfeldbacteria bacterium RIFCSPHIGHO2_02_FULL_42_14 TaxID=1798540 RepID=A0A1G2APS8_9BACT|nr:MAG: hypothetical protein A3B74_04690 [Candidatus Kerfeldbacteria bacterium RIFCSPHIGHO2_02_FULL_42_14]OGY81022.1 MAG: hypothetical protein A3E60_03410 [Candidatus Kerfeldbacteria bacterium RIFCSPHIGHO2_12_FULL_42_13]OGY84944.1 MAG: hypothetical protein A3I91_00465 [Candidatus Kerfeldbacteria bacterium RIFCSPLOWO2_02_FULL_42_19]OGY85643.1 MAG: hypothetical protein A3G01_04695 [Candidatus Kerfeldbacteria bacterium RIFCSPLOWO2_12_FULL_43_9]